MTFVFADGDGWSLGTTLDGTDGNKDRSCGNKYSRMDVTVAGDGLR